MSKVNGSKELDSETSESLRPTPDELRCAKGFYWSFHRNSDTMNEANLTTSLGAALQWGESLMDEYAALADTFAAYFSSAHYTTCTCRYCEMGRNALALIREYDTSAVSGDSEPTQEQSGVSH